MWGEQMDQSHFDGNLEPVDMHDNVGRVKYMLKNGGKGKWFLVSLLHDLLWFVGWISVEDELTGVCLDVVFVVGPESEILALGGFLGLFHLVVGGIALGETFVEDFSEAGGDDSQVDTLSSHVQRHEFTRVVLVFNRSRAFLANNLVPE